MEFIDLKTQYQNNKNGIEQRIQTVLQHGKFILGPEVSELEDKLADFCGTKHCIGVANGTDALQLALMALEVGPGDIVIVPAFSFFSTAEVVSLVGATPVFVDICPKTYNMSAESLKSAIVELEKSGLKAKAMITVDLFGLPADYNELQKVAEESNLYVIEDAAQGFGGKLDDKMACSFGHIATTSFFPAKPLGCYGDGGAIFTQDDELAKLLKSLRVHGKGNDKYDNVRIGMNSRLDTIQAAILLEKLNIFEAELANKQALADVYSQSLADNFVTPYIPKNKRSSWAQYSLIPKVKNRDFYMEKLKIAGIPSAIYYGKTLNNQSAYLGARQFVDLSASEHAAQLIFSLPMHAYVTKEQREDVIAVLNGV